MFKIVIGFDEINWFNKIVLKNEQTHQLRSHEFQIERQLVKRISSVLNSLPKEVVLSNDINEFKDKLYSLNLESDYSGA